MRRIVVVLAMALACSAMAISPAAAAVPGKEFTETGCEGYSDSVARLYTAGLGRQPEQGGFEFWMGEYTAGRWDLPRMATFFTQSAEFQESYGTLTQDGFIRQLYRNVLGREGEQGGVTFWNQQMNAGMDRGTVLLRFAESPENITNSGTVEPTLGPFNAGLTGPWTCSTFVPPSPGDSKNCSDFATQQEAQEWFDYYFPFYGDIARLDSDNDGVPCESASANEPAPAGPVLGGVPAPPVEPQPSEPEPPLQPVAPAEPTPPGNPGDSKNCSDFRTQAEAQAWHDLYFPFYGDVARLDADGDGRACESLP